MPERPAPYGVAAIVAPYGPEGGDAYAAEFTRHGWACVPVVHPPHSLPLLHADTAVSDAFPRAVTHAGPGLRRTLKKLRARHDVKAVLAAHPLGLPLADHLARGLGLPGCDPASAQRRHCRGAQMDALPQTGLAAPQGIRATTLAAAQRWAAFVQTPAYVLAPADTAVHGAARVCRSPAEIRAAWHVLRRAARRHTGEEHLVLQAHQPGPQYIVHSVSSPRPCGSATDHTVTDIWSEIQTGPQLTDRVELMATSSPFHRVLSAYTRRVLDCLGVRTGPARSRIAFVPGRGPVLLAARAWATSTPADTAVREATGHDLLRSAVHAAIGDAARPGTAGRAVLRRPDDQRHIALVRLIAPAAGRIDGPSLDTLTALPSVARIVGPLEAGAPVVRTVDRRTSPGEVLLVAPTQRALAEGYRAVRAVEAAGLYQGGTR
ncbi:hypothetical protein [Streptomyces sp. NPDC059788]|uniref:hypothetical protein n=1 Tax=Streptomyces sp. NPDC059788 TaxID=3346948 RepID=UPI00365C7859